MKISHKIISGTVAGILTIVGMGEIANTQSFNVSASVKQTSTNKVKLQKFTKIKVDDAINDVVIKSGEDYRVTYTGENKNKPSFNVNNGLLTIATKSHGIFGWFNFNFFSKSTGGTVVIEVPKKLQALNVDTSNGNVTVSNISVDKGKISASNGDVTLDRIKSSNGIKIDDSNGDITVKNSKFSGYDLSTSNGDIKYYGTSISSDFKKNTSNNNVLSVGASNGDIEVK